MRPLASSMTSPHGRGGSPQQGWPEHSRGVAAGAGPAGGGCDGGDGDGGDGDGGDGGACPSHADRTASRAASRTGFASDTCAMRALNGWHPLTDLFRSPAIRITSSHASALTTWRTSPDDGRSRASPYRCSRRRVRGTPGHRVHHAARERRELDAGVEHRRQRALLQPLTSRPGARRGTPRGPVAASGRPVEHARRGSTPESIAGDESPA